MRKTKLSVAVTAIAAVIAGVSLYSQGRGVAVEHPMPAGDSFRILLGVTDREATPWDGSITVSPGAVESLRGWRFVAGDSTDGVSSWECSTRNGGAQGANTAPVLPNGIVVTTANQAPGAQLNVTTQQGNFSFAAS